MDPEPGTKAGGEGEGERAVLLRLWEHHWWATGLVLEAARALSVEEFGRELGVSYGSFHGALAHLVGAEMVWLARVRRGESPAGVPGAADLPTLEAAEAEWRRCEAGWRGVFDGDDPGRVVSYRTTKGAEFHDPLWLILAHLVDHGSTYRGVLLSALRLLGRVPPATGVIFYERHRGSG